MTGSAFSNAFRLILWRGCSVHLLLRPAGSLPSLSRALTLRSAGVCHRALRRLPARDSHPPEPRVFQDAPSPQGYHLLIIACNQVCPISLGLVGPGGLKPEMARGSY